MLSLCSLAHSQVKYEIELLPDNETYLISFVSEVTYSPPSNKIVSGQVTLRMPHGIGPNLFQVTDLTMETPGAEWQANDFVQSPVEAPSFDYLSFALTTPGTDVYDLQAGVKVPVFSFKNGADFGADSIAIMVNETDPFAFPNSLSVNVGNSLVVFGGGPFNSYGGTVGDGTAPNTPQTLCTDEMITPVVLCGSDPVYLGQPITQDTIWEELHYTSFFGCDSMFITTIELQNSLATNIDTSICEGEIFRGMTILQDEQIVENLTSSAGCDSTVTYFVEMATATAATVSETVLRGDVVNGVAVFSDTSMVVVLTNAAGCDSTLTTTVNVVDVPVEYVTVERCIGEGYNGEFFTMDTTLMDTLTSFTGFDSIIVTDVFIYDTYFTNENRVLCAGEPFGGTVYTENTTITDSYLSVHGCDSVFTINIEILEPVVFSVDTTLCAGEIFMGQSFENDTTLTESILSVNGCDSIVHETIVHVSPAVEVAIDGATALCAGSVSTLTASGGTDYVWSTGATGNSIEVGGAMTVSVTATNSFGCQAIASAEITESGLEAQPEVTPPNCHDDLSGSIELGNVSGGNEPYYYSIDGGGFFTTSSEFADLPPGVYDIYIKDGIGCFWEGNAEISTPDELWLDAGDDQNIKLGDRVLLNALTNVSDPDTVLWSPADGLECADCLETSATPVETTTYHLLVIDKNGCSVEDELTVIVRPGRQVFVPTAFSPNGDGHNDNFTVFAGDNVLQVRKFVVFERWGGQVFSAENLPPNDPSLGWDGTWRNKPMDVGTYVWMAEVEFLDGKVRLFEGGVNLMR